MWRVRWIALFCVFVIPSLVFAETFDIRDAWVGKPWEGKCGESSDSKATKANDFKLIFKKSESNSNIKDKIFVGRGYGIDYYLEIYLPEDYRNISELVIDESSIELKPTYKTPFKIGLRKSLDKYGSPLIEGSVIIYERTSSGDLSVKHSFGGIHVVR